MSAINYSRISCPYSAEPIAECECQNCVIARLDHEYELWREGVAGMRVMVAAVSIVAVAFVYGVFRLVSR
jgi:hypothetical protein